MSERTPYNAQATAARVLGAVAWHLAQHGHAVITINGVQVMDLDVPAGMTDLDREAVLHTFNEYGERLA